MKKVSLTSDDETSWGNAGFGAGGEAFTFKYSEGPATPKRKTLSATIEPNAAEPPYRNGKAYAIANLIRKLEKYGKTNGPLYKALIEYQSNH